MLITKAGLLGIQKQYGFAYRCAHNATILDVGCGPGISLLTLETIAANIVGIDVSRQALFKDKLLLSNTSHLIRSDACHLPPWRT